MIPRESESKDGDNATEQLHRYMTLHINSGKVVRDTLLILPGYIYEIKVMPLILPDRTLT
jgi:hypothetical protein